MDWGAREDQKYVHARDYLIILNLVNARWYAFGQAIHLSHVMGAPLSFYAAQTTAFIFVALYVET